MPDQPSSNPKQFIQGAPVLHVPDVEATARYYRDVLGFTWDFGDQTYAVVWRDNSAVHFVKDEHAPIGVHLFQWVRDVDAYHQENRAPDSESNAGDRQLHRDRRPPARRQRRLDDLTGYQTSDGKWVLTRKDGTPY